MRTHEYFVDLTPFETTRSIFPKTLHVGWLSAEHEFERGDVDNETLAKLKEFLFAYVHCEECKAQGKPQPAFCPTVDLARHHPYSCALSNDENVVVLEPSDLKYFKNTKNFTLGNTYFALRNESGNLSYYFPSLIYHYVKDHNYRPPDGFLKALRALDFLSAYNDNDDVAVNEQVPK